MNRKRTIGQLLSNQDSLTIVFPKEVEVPKFNTVRVDPNNIDAIKEMEPYHKGTFEVEEEHILVYGPSLNYSLRIGNYILPDGVEVSPMLYKYIMNIINADNLIVLDMNHNAVFLGTVIRLLEGGPTIDGETLIQVDVNERVYSMKLLWDNDFGMVGNDLGANASLFIDAQLAINFIRHSRRDIDTRSLQCLMED